MNVKPWKTEDFADLIDGGKVSDEDQQTLATCIQRDELVAALQAIRTELDRPGKLLSGVLTACNAACGVLSKWKL